MKRVRILGQTYKIEKRDLDDYGYVDMDRKIIVLSRTLSKQDFMHKLLHEILHVITITLNLPMADCGDYNDNDEWTEDSNQTINHMQLDLLAFALSTLKPS